MCVLMNAKHPDARRMNAVAQRARADAGQARVQLQARVERHACRPSARRADARVMAYETNERPPVLAGITVGEAEQLAVQPTYVGGATSCRHPHAEQRPHTERGAESASAPVGLAG